MANLTSEDLKIPPSKYECKWNTSFAYVPLNRNTKREPIILKVNLYHHTFRLYIKHSFCYFVLIWGCYLNDYVVTIFFYFTDLDHTADVQSVSFSHGKGAVS